MRRTFNGANATPLGIVTYDPWGTPESGSVPTFGFTSELQDVGSGLVNLVSNHMRTILPALDMAMYRSGMTLYRSEMTLYCS